MDSGADSESGALVCLSDGAVADAARVVGDPDGPGRVILHFDGGGDGLKEDLNGQCMRLIDTYCIGKAYIMFFEPNAMS